MSHLVDGIPWTASISNVRTHGLPALRGFKIVEGESADGDRPVPAYSTSEADGRPIIDREGILFGDYVDFDQSVLVLATIEQPGIWVTPCLGYTELDAGMLCYVALKFGDGAIHEHSPVNNWHPRRT